MRRRARGKTSVTRWILIATAVLAAAGGAFFLLRNLVEDIGALAQPPANPTRNVGVVCINTRDARMSGIIETLTQGLYKGNCAVDTRNAGGDGARFMTEVKSLCERGVDALVIFPPDKKNAQAAADIAKEKDIPIVSVDVKAEGSIYYGADYEKMGDAVGQTYYEQVKKEGKSEYILMVVLHRPMVGAGEPKLERAVDKYIELAGYNPAQVVLIDGRNSSEEAKSQLEYQLTQYPDATGFNVMCLNEIYAQAVSEVIGASGKGESSSVAFFTFGDAGQALIEAPLLSIVGYAIKDDYGPGIADMVNKLLKNNGKAQDITVTFERLK